METEQIEQPISDPHITSSSEIEEKRMEEQKGALEQIVQQIDVIAERTSERDESIIRETKCLEQQLAQEEREIAAITAMENILLERTKEEIKHMEQLSNKLKETIPHMQNLERLLDHHRQLNQARLHADPIFGLLLKESRLKNELGELGVLVHPPCDLDGPSNV